MAREEFVPVFEEDESTIRTRLLERISDEWRKEPGDFIYDAVATAPLELKSIEAILDFILKNAFALHADGKYLDYQLSEVGLTRAQAIAAKRQLSITADAGVTIPADQTLTTIVLDDGGNPLEFTADTAVTFDAVGAKTINITCSIAGEIGNVPEGSEFILSPTIPGVSSIVDQGLTLPGMDEESDESAWERYDFKVKNPDTGGNKNDYVRWAEEVTGVGGAKTIPRWNGNGSVKLVLVGTDFTPAVQSVVDEVQAYIDPLLDADLEAEKMEIGGYGVVEDNQPDDSGSSMMLAYDSQGDGLLTYGENTETLIETENHFIARLKVKVDDVSGASGLLQLSIQDRGTKQPVKQTSSSSQDARVVLTAADLQTNYEFMELPFYWDGLQPLEIEIRRLSTETVTTVWADLINFVSIYGQGLGEGKAPGGARLLAKAADPLAIDIDATVTFTAGADPAEVQTAFEQSVKEYLAGIVFTGKPVVWARIGSLLINVEGVSNYTDLAINGGTADVPVGTEEVAILGQVNL